MHICKHNQSTPINWSIFKKKKKNFKSWLYLVKSLFCFTADVYCALSLIYILLCEFFSSFLVKHFFQTWAPESGTFQRSVWLLPKKNQWVILLWSFWCLKKSNIMGDGWGCNVILEDYFMLMQTNRIWMVIMQSKENCIKQNQQQQQQQTLSYKNIYK